MGIRNIPYLLGQGNRNIFRHKSSSFFCLAIMMTNIFLFSLSYCLLSNINSLVKNAQESVGVTVFFDEGMSDAEIRALGSLIGESEEVSRMNYTSAEEAWESFRSVYFEGHEELAEGFIEDNPLANSANYEIFLADISHQQEVVSWLESIDGVRKVNYSNVIAEGMSNVGQIIRIGSFGLLALLLIIAVSLISNSISLSISIRSEEIHIMRFVGATAAFIMTPFLWQGFLIGLLGALLPLLLVYFLYDPIVTLVADKLSAFGSYLQFLDRAEIFKQLIPAALLLGVGIGLLGSILSIRRHIRV